ncbi:MAG: PAS domain S-box protein [Thermoplasmatota archaeon]
MDVLFVDDESALLEQAKIFLERNLDKVKIKTFTSVKDALKSLKNKHFDAIIADYQMPEMNGLEFLDYIRSELNYDIPYIIFTGKGREEVAMEALNLGANRYIQKGGDPKSQYAILADALVQECEHYKKDKALRKSEREKSRILEGSAELIAYQNQKHEVIWANSAAGQSVNKNSEDLIGRKCYDIWQNREEICEICPVEKTLRSGKIERSEVQSYDGRYWIITGNPVMDDKGNVEGIVETALEITDRKKTEQRLKESEERLNRSQKIAKVGSWEIDLDTNELNWSDETYRIFGFPIGELMCYERVLEKIHPDDREYVEKEWKRALKDGDYDIEHRIVVDDEVKWLREKAEIKFDEDGEPTDILGIVQDITEIKEKEKEIQDLNRFQKTVVENANVWINVVDMEGNIVIWNEGAEKISGYSKEEVEGNNQIWRWLYPNKKIRENILEGHYRMRNNDAFENVETTIQCKNGEEKIISWQSQVLKDENGEPIGSLAIGQDVTEKREMEMKLIESEKRYKSIFEESPIGLWEGDYSKVKKYIDELKKEGVIDFESYFKNNKEAAKKCSDLINVLSMNNRLLELYEAGSVEDILENWHEILPEEGVDNWIGELESIAQGKKHYTGESVNRTIHGKKIDIFFKWSVAEGHEEDYSRIIISLIDVSKRKKAEDREKFIHSLLRHDVRNKTHLVLGYIDLIKDIDLPNEANDYLQKMRICVEDTIDIIEKVRTLRQAQQEDIREVDLAPSIYYAVSQYKSIAEEYGMNINTSDISNCRVMAGTLINHLLSNLIENSIYHSEGSLINISMDVGRENVVTIIEDNGVGIPDEKKEVIFEKGYTTDEERGTGLGLFLVKTLVDIYDGSVTVKDSELGGVRFDIILKKA